MVEVLVLMQLVVELLDRAFKVEQERQIGLPVVVVVLVQLAQLPLLMKLVEMVVLE